MPRRGAPWLLAAVIACCGAALLPVIWQMDAPFGAVRTPWWALGVAFLLAERYPLHVHVRDETHAISLSELVTAVGLVTAAPLALVSACVGGSLTAILLERRLPPVKIAFNASLFTLNAALAGAVYHLVLRAAAPESPTGWVALLAGLLVAQVAGNLGVSAVLRASGGRLPRGFVRQTMAVGLAVTTVTGAVVLLAVVVAAADLRGLGVVGVVVAMLVASFRLYDALSRRHDDLRAVYAFTQAAAPADGLQAHPSTVLRHAREQLRVRSAVLVVAPDGEVELALRDDAAGVRPEPVRRAGQVLATLGAAPGPCPISAVPGVVVVEREEPGLVVPLRLSGELAGWLAVEGRFGRRGAFGADDASLLQALAAQIEMSLDRTRLMARMRHDARHDRLTGLPNRAELAERIDRAVATNGDGLVAVLMLDLRRFKDVNDTLGHEQGDALLKRIGWRLVAVAGPKATVARFGADEFGVLLPGVAHVRDIVEVAARLRRALGHPVEADGVDLVVDASIGVAVAPGDGDDADTLLRRADIAMYAAKARGVGMEFYATELDHHSPRRLSLAAAIRPAVREGDIEVHVQPQVDIRDGRPVSVECLARWTHPELGPVRPDEFIELAEQTGVIRDLTDHVLRTGLSAAAEWERRGHDVRVAVNLSPTELIDHELPARVAQALRATGRRPSSLVLEITETSLMQDAERTRAVLDELELLGVELAVDDFGTGYSSLRYLQRLPVSELKIDRSFVQHLATERNDEIIVGSTIRLAHDLDLRVVAEGVEDEASWDVLRRMGCDVAQGYYFGRPMALDVFACWLEEHTRPAGEVTRMPDISARRGAA